MHTFRIQALAVALLFALTPPLRAGEKGDGCGDDEWEQLVVSRSVSLLPDGIDPFRLLRDGDPRQVNLAMGQIKQQYERRIKAFFESRGIRNDADLDDIAQETFLSLYTIRKDIDPEKETEALVFQLASRRLTDHLRRLYRRKKNMPEHRLEEVQEKIGEAGLLGDRKTFTPLTNSEVDEAAARLSRLYAYGLALQPEFHRTISDIGQMVDGFEGPWGVEMANRTGVTQQDIANKRWLTVEKTVKFVRNNEGVPDTGKDALNLVVAQRAGGRLLGDFLEADRQIRSYRERIEVTAALLPTDQEQLVSHWLHSALTLPKMNKSLKPQERARFASALAILRKVPAPEIIAGTHVKLEDLVVSGRFNEAQPGATGLGSTPQSLAAENVKPNEGGKLTLPAPWKGKPEPKPPVLPSLGNPRIRSMAIAR